MVGAPSPGVVGFTCPSTSPNRRSGGVGVNKVGAAVDADDDVDTNGVSPIRVAVWGSGISVVMIGCIGSPNCGDSTLPPTDTIWGEVVPICEVEDTLSDAGSRPQSDQKVLSAFSAVHITGTRAAATAVPTVLAIISLG